MQRPTPIQANTFREIYTHQQNCIGAAHTGSGKTAAFMIPILQRLAEDPYGIFALVLTPTRELAFQISEQVRVLGNPIGVRDCVVVGGLDMLNQAKSLAEKPHVVIATPGRLADVLMSCPDVKMNHRVRFLVLDEADRLMEESFSGDLEVIFDHLNNGKKQKETKGTLMTGGGDEKRQTLMFSATLSQEMVDMEAMKRRKCHYYNDNEEGEKHQRLQKSDEDDEKKNKRKNSDDDDGFVSSVVDGAAPLVCLPKLLEQKYVFIPQMLKDCYLAFILRCFTGSSGAGDDDDDDDDEGEEEGIGKVAKSLRKVAGVYENSVIVFAGSCRSCHAVQSLLYELGFQAVALHSSMAQGERLASLQRFRSLQVRILVSTDVGSRGLDIPEVGLVLNYDIPANPTDYVHRVGRTARRGRRGLAVSLVSQYDIGLLQGIEAHVGRRMEELEAVPTTVAVDNGDKEAMYVPLVEDEVVKDLNTVNVSRRKVDVKMRETGFGKRKRVNREKHNANWKDDMAKKARKQRN
eukprot:Nk52_evm31s1485 gene=Nk52_evmTU31s1485